MYLRRSSGPRSRLSDEASLASSSICLPYTYQGDEGMREFCRPRTPGSPSYTDRYVPPGSTPGRPNGDRRTPSTSTKTSPPASYATFAAVDSPQKPADVALFPTAISDDDAKHSNGSVTLSYPCTDPATLRPRPFHRREARVFIRRCTFATLRYLHSFSSSYHHYTLPKQHLARIIEFVGALQSVFSESQDYSSASVPRTKSAVGAASWISLCRPNANKIVVLYRRRRAR